MAQKFPRTIAGWKTAWQFAFEGLRLVRPAIQTRGPRIRQCSNFGPLQKLWDPVHGASQSPIGWFDGRLGALPPDSLSPVGDERLGAPTILFSIDSRCTRHDWKRSIGRPVGCGINPGQARGWGLLEVGVYGTRNPIRRARRISATTSTRWPRCHAVNGPLSSARGFARASGLPRGPEGHPSGVAPGRDSRFSRSHFPPLG